MKIKILARPEHKFFYALLADSSRSVTKEEQTLTIKRFIEAGQIIRNKDKPVNKYIERTHIQQFIRDKIEINLEAFENGSSRLHYYQGISISGGSGTGKTRHGYETINIIKGPKQIHDGSFEVIHIFVQIFPESSLVHFDKRPPRDPSTGRYPHDSSHVIL
ncbi:4783_t:CDS:2 [Funneliformis caledonium]|uniref:4783_t:CDS:1 n=1 Tax=Funneliformis caledonium TaxID=1117310 RepID=A0A9N8ZPA4_9GLOM|nr:4783_t:CDS:2 [Funneliformis caledonium]